MEPMNPVREHIEMIMRHEQEFLGRRSRAERWGDATAGVVGSLSFVAGQLLFVLCWILINTVRVFPFRPFDPVPYPLLSGFLTLEGILLASFILMRQARIGRRVDERDHLMLQVLLLTEKEITASLGINREIAGSLGLGDIARNREIERLAKQTSIDEVAKSVQESLEEPDET